MGTLTLPKGLFRALKSMVLKSQVGIMERQKGLYDFTVNIFLLRYPRPSVHPAKAVWRVVSFIFASTHYPTPSQAAPCEGHEPARHELII